MFKPYNNFVAKMQYYYFDCITDSTVCGSQPRRLTSLELKSHFREAEQKLMEEVELMPDWFLLVIIYQKKKIVAFCAI